jgi:hypothetical protein
MRGLINSLLALLIMAQAAFGAQVITIPEGTTIYGPISVSVFNRYARFELDRSKWTDPNIKLSAVMTRSTDGGKTFLLPSVWLCAFESQGGPIISNKPNPTPTPITRRNCQLPEGTTNIRVTTTVAGGSITLGSIPKLETRQNR